MKKGILISILTLLLGFQGMAQYILPKLEDVEKAKQREMLVPLLDEDPKLVKKYSKDSQKLQKYQSGIKEYNHILETAVKRDWAFSKVTFSTREEVKNLTKQRNSNFTVLEWTHWEVKLEGDWYSWGRSRMTFRLCESQTPMMQIFLPTFEMREADVVFGMHFFQQQLNYRLSEGKKATYDNMISANAAELPKKTLLINKADVRDKFTLDEIKENYPYPVEIVPYQQIERAILSKDPTYAFAMVAPRDFAEEQHLQYVADAATGKMLGRSSGGSLSYKGVTAGRFIKPKHLKNYLDFLPK